MLALIVAMGAGFANAAEDEPEPLFGSSRGQAAARASTLESGDVVTEMNVAANAERMASVLVDLGRLGPLLPRECVGSFTPGTPSRGAGARANLRYDYAAMHRRLDVTVTRVDPGPPAVVDFDHAGNRGFVSRWTLTPTHDGAQVRVHTALYAPPWPFRAYFFGPVHAEWQACQRAYVWAVAKAAGPFEPPVEQEGGVAPTAP